jgi:hypothetical protein
MAKSVPILVALATPAGAQHAPTAAPTSAAGANTGTVILFREKKFVGGGVSCIVREGEAELGKLSSGTYFVVYPNAGTHHYYAAHSELKEVLALDVHPGETYYVICGVIVGGFGGHPKLAPSDAMVFDEMKDTLKDVKQGAK